MDWEAHYKEVYAELAGYRKANDLQQIQALYNMVLTEQAKVAKLEDEIRLLEVRLTEVY